MKADAAIYMRSAGGKEALGVETKRMREGMMEGAEQGWRMG